MGHFAPGDGPDMGPPSPGTAVVLSDGVEALGLDADQIPADVPQAFTAVGEALADGRRASDACEVVGRMLSSNGVSLEEALADLQTTYRLVMGNEPAYADACALALGWSEQTLSYLHDLSCTDPLTGLSSMAHLRGRLTELYRGGAVRGAHGTREPGAAYALVVVECRTTPRYGLAEQVFGTDLRMSQTGESVRSVFSGSETISRLGVRRIAVLAARDDTLNRRTSLLRRLLEPGHRGHGGVRIWVEGLPATNESAAALLDELSRDQGG